ncbi:hypothetical protein BDD14_5527 [Edaphobacter modestus]|uniref:Uncharacterized protein n=1 Tax=Edaphobacter modestus TaxID=388466 RepID=A0A4V2G334_9BACT|nr:hypothetical protein BDD14_5527 [Edaphobacter modestus]
MSTDKNANFLRSKTSTRNQTCDLYIEDADYHQLTPIVRKTAQEASEITEDCISPSNHGQTVSIDLDLDIWEYRTAILNEDLLRSRLYLNGLQVSAATTKRSDKHE